MFVPGKRRNPRREKLSMQTMYRNSIRQRHHPNFFLSFLLFFWTQSSDTVSCKGLQKEIFGSEFYSARNLFLSPCGLLSLNFFCFPLLIFSMFKTDSKSMSCASMQNKFSVNSELIPCCGVPWDCQRLDFLISQLQVYPLGGEKKKKRFPGI